MPHATEPRSFAAFAALQGSLEFLAAIGILGHCQHSAIVVHISQNALDGLDLPQPRFGRGAVDRYEQLQRVPELLGEDAEVVQLFTGTLASGSLSELKEAFRQAGQGGCGQIGKRLWAGFGPQRIELQIVAPFRYAGAERQASEESKQGPLRLLARAVDGCEQSGGRGLAALGEDLSRNIPIA